MTAPATTDPFGAPKTFSGQVGPALRCIGERLVAIVPKAIYRQERNPFYKANQPESYNNSPLRDRMVCDLILVDGPAFMYGGDPTKSIPDTQGPFPSPGVIHDYEIIKSSIVNSIEDHQVGGGVVLGRLYKAPTSNGNSAWNFGKQPEPGTPERARAIQVYEAYKNGQLPTHVPTAPVANPVQPQMSYPQGMQPGYNAPQFGQAQPGFQATPAGPVPGQVPPFTGQPMGGQQFGMNPAAPNWTPGAPAAPVMSAPPAAPADPTANIPAPAGLEAVWGMFTPEQRQQALAMQPNAQPTY